MANLKDVIYLSNEDYETLVSTGTVTIEGQTLTYDENNIYITPDKLASSTEDGLMSSTDKAKLDTISGVTSTVTQGSTDVVTSGAVWTAIDNLPEPMIYKGTLGTGGTITDLPAAASSNEGFTYKVITAGTYASQAAKVGDVFISNGSAWTLVPAGDDVEDTWRDIKVNDTLLLDTTISSGYVNFKQGSNVTISGSGNDITISATGTVTSVAAQPASGSHLTVSGSPITSSGTLTVGVETDYSIPSDASQTFWDAKIGSIISDDSEQAESDISYLADATYTAPTITTDTAVKAISGGSGSFSATRSTSGSGTSARRTLTVSHSHTGASISDTTSVVATYDEGTFTKDTKYLHTDTAVSQD